MNKKKDEINTVEKTSKIYINKLKEKFDKEDEDLKKYSVEEYQKQYWTMIHDYQYTLNSHTNIKNLVEEGHKKMKMKI